MTFLAWKLKISAAAIQKIIVSFKERHVQTQAEDVKAPFLGRSWNRWSVFRISNQTDGGLQPGSSRKSKPVLAELQVGLLTDIQQPMKSIERCADAATSECSLCGFNTDFFSFEWWMWIMFPWLDWDWWKVPRSLPSRSFKTGTCVNVTSGRFVWKLGLLENNLLPRNQQRDEKPKSPHHSWERAENKNNKTPRCRKKNTKKQNKPRNIWILCRNHNLYIPSTIMYN